MKKVWITLALLHVSALLGCSSTLVVKSEPADADVFIHLPGSEIAKKIGKTPFEIDEEAIQEITSMNPSSEDTFELTVEKEGYTKERILVPASRFGTLSTTVQVKLRPGSFDSKVASQLIQHLLNAQKLAHEGAFDRAQAEIDRALTVDQRFVRAMTLRGAIFFLQRNYASSLEWYEKALSLEPNLPDAVKMIGQLKNMSRTGGKQ